MYTTARFSVKGKSGRCVKKLTGPKTDRLACKYLTINILILFKLFKTHLKFVKKC